eukprot:1156927-Pelagomonas_calceolata.AAC.6
MANGCMRTHSKENGDMTVPNTPVSGDTPPSIVTTQVGELLPQCPFARSSAVTAAITATLSLQGP